MNTYEFLVQNTSDIESKIGYTFLDKSHLHLAFIHRSFLNENRKIPAHNERLEFLGDSVLGMLVAEYLYRSLPNTPEGELSHMRSRLVDAPSCMAYVQKLEVGHYVLMGKGELMNGGKGRDSILSDLFEAIIGAIFLDGGLAAVKKFLFDHFSEEIANTLNSPTSNWKALLQDFCQKKFQQTPVYKLEEEHGPGHNKMFKISVFLQEEILGQGDGSSKKEAQQAAAEQALKKLKPGN